MVERPDTVQVLVVTRWENAVRVRGGGLSRRCLSLKRAENKQKISKGQPRNMEKVHCKHKKIPEGNRSKIQQLRQAGCVAIRSVSAHVSRKRYGTAQEREKAATVRGECRVEDARIKKEKVRSTGLIRRRPSSSLSCISWRERGCPGQLVSNATGCWAVGVRG